MKESFHMAFTDEDKKELTVLIADAMDSHRERRRLLYAEEAARNPEKIDTKLYLITIQGRIAFSDERGRSILHDVFYGRVTVKNGEVPYGSMKATAVAFGDGKLLDKPVTVMLPHSPFMVEVDEGFLETA